MRYDHQQSTTPSKEEINRTALKAFFAITDKWKINDTQKRILLAVPPATYSRWKSKGYGELGADTLERISYIMGIYKALQILLPTDAAANEWIHKPNSAPLFNGNTALDKMLKGHVIDLADVRRYLDAERGGW